MVSEEEEEGVGAERAGQAVSSVATVGAAAPSAAVAAEAEAGGNHLGMLEISLSVLNRFPTGAVGAA